VQIRNNQERGTTMLNAKLNVAAIAVACTYALSACVSASAFEDNFAANPIEESSGWSLVGSNESELADGSPAAAFEWTAGTLIVNYNSQSPSSRLMTLLGATVTGTDSFRLGATCTILSDNYVPQPDKMSSIISFALVNSATTGTNRSGSMTTAADVFDNVEMTYFPNISIDYGGPYLSPTVFGSDDGTHNVWANFAPFSAQEVDLPLDTPLSFALDYNAHSRTITWSVREVGGDYIFQAGLVDLTGLSTLFEVDSFAISMYNDGWSDPAGPPSCVATVEFTQVSFTGYDPPALEGTPSATAVGLAVMTLAMAAAACIRLARRNAPEV